MLRRRLLVRFFALLYTRLAWAYDLVAWLVSAGHWYRWAAAALPFIGAGPVLEVGCGRGRLLLPIRALGYPVVGVDGSMEMARHAARHSGQPVLRADGRTLPFPDRHFATLVTTFPAPYILEEATRQEFARVVQPGGLWLWVDAPALSPALTTTLARLVTRVAQGRPTDPDSRLRASEHDGPWAVALYRVPVGPTNVAVRVARRLDMADS